MQMKSFLTPRLESVCKRNSRDSYLQEILLTQTKTLLYLSFSAEAMNIELAPQTIKYVI